MSIDNYVNGMSEGSQQRDSVKDKVYKRPVSVLVVIYAQDTKRVLMLQRRDDPEFWQSVTGSVEEGETASQAAMREVKEEVAIDVAAEQLTLIDCQRTVEFEIFLIYVIAMHRVCCAIQNPGSALRCRTSVRSFLVNIWPTSGLMRQLRRRSPSHGATGRRLKNL